MRWMIGALALLPGCELLPGVGTTGPTTTTTTTPGTESGVAGVVDAVFAEDSIVDSCGDIAVNLQDADDTHVLSIRVGGGLAEQARLKGEDVVVTFDLPHPDVGVTALWGSHLSEWYSCDDVVQMDPTIDGELQAITGTLTVTVTPHPDANDFEPYAFVTLLLQDITFTEDANAEETLFEAELADLFVGWWPG